MTDYKLTEKDRAEGLRLYRKADLAMREFQLWQAKMGETYKVPWSNPSLNLDTGEFSPSGPAAAPVKRP